MTSPYVQPEFPAFSELPEPRLAFGERQRVRGTDPHPLKGLVTHGPFSERTLSGFLDAIRIAHVAPAGDAHVASALVSELRARHRPTERTEYLVDFPGFRPIFGVDVAIAPPDASVVLPASLDEDLAKSADPRQLLSDALETAIVSLARRSGTFDVVLVRLPDRWEPWFTGDDDFNLRHFIKAAAAQRGIATQIIRDNALTYSDRCSVMWRLSIALYTKAGGVPWKLAETRPGSAFVGLGYALRTSASQRFVRCAAQVFDDRGAGLQFVGYTAAESDGTRIDGDNPFLTRQQMHAVLARSLLLYQAQHRGALPQRIVVHKTTEFKTLETEGAFDALARVPDVELIQLQQDTPWRGVRGTADGKPDSWPVLRGTLVHLSGTDLLLWTQGNAPTVARRGNFYKEGRGIPHPVLLTRAAGHSKAAEAAAEVLALTKMDWNNDSLYNQIPVTIAYAKDLAQILRRLPSLAGGPFHFRHFM